MYRALVLAFDRSDLTRNQVKKTAILIFSLAFAVISGCAPRPPAPKLASVTIAFQEWVGYGLFYLAAEKGFMEQEGIELVFVDEQLDSARRDAFKQGMLDFEAGTLDLLVAKAAQDTPIVAVMEIDQSFGSDAIVATQDIKTLDNLAGKRVALARDDVGEAFISTLFYKKGLSFNNVTIVPKSAEKVAQAFLDGEADACVTWEPQVSQALQRPGARILASTKEYPGIIIDVLNVQKDLAVNHPEVVKKVMRGWFEALKFYREHPKEANEIIAKYYKISPEQFQKQTEGLKWEDYTEQSNHPEHQQWLDGFDAIAEVKVANTRISKKPNAANFIDHTFMETLYETRP